MDNILEIIIPLIFAAIYFFGNMISGKKEDESAPKSVPRRRNEGQEADAIERQRRIQEEIRRKIMERRRAAEGTPGAPDSRPAPAENQPRAGYAEPPAELEQQKQGSAGASRTASVPSQEPESTFSWDSSDNAYQSQMQERLQQIEATKRRAEQLKQQVGMPQKSSEVSPLTTHSSRFARGPVRKSLRDRAAARAAFIYAEVLGQPISQRKQSSVPGLSN